MSNQAPIGQAYVSTKTHSPVIWHIDKDCWKCPDEFRMLQEDDLRRDCRECFYCSAPTGLELD